MEKNTQISDKDISQLLNFIFVDAENLYKTLVPNGWNQSEYVRFFHPTARQQLKEHSRITKRINNLTKTEKTEKQEGEKIDFKQDELDGINGYPEFLYILGLSVYDIFSMNHEVGRPDGAIFNMGSFRGSGRFMADYLNSYPDRVSEEYGYLDFYMGSIWIQSRADLLPFYLFIFEKLKKKGCTWTYYFPKLSVVDLKNITEKTEGGPLKEYNPEQNVSTELAAAKKEQEIQNLRDELDDIYDGAFEKAKYEPLTKTVQAYKNVYRILPGGHPQKEFE